MGKQVTSSLFGSITLIIGIFLLVKYKKTSFWWWIFLLVIIVPTMSQLGYVLAKENENEKQKRIGCESQGKSFFMGVCLG